MNYYTADLHFGDRNIIAYARRPFSDLSEMEETIIRNINDTVGEKDTLYILGDCGCANTHTTECLKKIKAAKVLIVGNWDDLPLEKSSSFRRLFKEIRHVTLIRDGDHQVALSHYPLAEWPDFFKGSYHLYGHVHGHTDLGGGYMMQSHYPDRAFDVGVDAQGFFPVTLAQLLSR